MLDIAEFLLAMRELTFLTDFAFSKSFVISTEGGLKFDVVKVISLIQLILGKIMISIEMSILAEIMLRMLVLSAL